MSSERHKPRDSEPEPPNTAAGASVNSTLGDSGPVERDTSDHAVHKAAKRRKSPNRVKSGRRRQHHSVHGTSDNQNISSALGNQQLRSDQQSPSHDHAEELLRKGRKLSSTPALQFANAGGLAKTTSPVGKDLSTFHASRGIRKSGYKHRSRRSHAGSGRGSVTKQAAHLTTIEVESGKAAEDGGRTRELLGESSSNADLERGHPSNPRDCVQNLPSEVFDAEPPFVTGASRAALTKGTPMTVAARVPQVTAVSQKPERDLEPVGTLLFASVSTNVARKQRSAARFFARSDKEDNKEVFLRRLERAAHLIEHRSSRDQRATGTQMSSCGPSGGLTRGRKAIFMAYIAPLTLLVALLVVVASSVLSHSSRLPHIEEVPSQVDREPPCSSTACLLVVAAVNRSTDYNVAPCADFYSHVCGHWNSPRSYIEENRRLLNARVEGDLRRQLLNSRQPKTRQEQDEHQMAHFYFSCRYFTLKPYRRSTQVVLRNVGIDIASWLAASTFQELFNNILRSAVRSGLRSIVAIRTASTSDQVQGRRIFIDVGQDMYHAVGSQDGVLEGFVDDALADLRPQGINTSTLAVTNLDWNITKIVEGFNLSSHFSDMYVKDLPVPSVKGPQQQLTWNKGLADNIERNDTGDVSLRTKLVRARHLKEIGEVIARLHSVDLSLARLYALLLPVVQVVKFFYLLRTSGDDHIKFCLRATGEHFKTLFPGWLARILEKPQAVRYFERLVTTVKYFAMRLPRASDGFSFSAIRQAVMHVRSVGNSGGHMTAPRLTVDANRTAYGDDFLLNVALAAKVEPFGDNIASVRVEQQLCDTVHYDPDGFVVPSVYLAEDLMHSEAAEPSLDYSVVGFRLLASWVQILVNQDPSYAERLANYRHCVLTKVPEAIFFTEDDPIVDAMLFAPWALDVAFTAAKRQLRELEEEPPQDTGPRDRLFFRRFCHAKCGDPKAALLCNYATRHSEYFNTVFECPPLPYIVC